jgi:hypothetical protein
LDKTGYITEFNADGRLCAGAAAAAGVAVEAALVVAGEAGAGVGTAWEAVEGGTGAVGDGPPEVFRPPLEDKVMSEEVVFLVGEGFSSDPRL